MDKNSFLIDLSESERTDLWRVDFEEQSEPQKVFSSVWELESEVNNGGFDQYFRNGEIESISYAPTALQAIGAVTCAGIAERAIGTLAPLPQTEPGRIDVLDSLTEDSQAKLAALDAEFLSYPDNLTELLFEYVSKHPDAFGAI